MTDHKDKVKELNEKYQYQLNVERLAREEKESEEKEVLNKKEQFYEKIKKSDDLTD